MKRPPSLPPDLLGYRPLSHLGSGGFADVFLYEQDLPRRRVAVKVLIESSVNVAVQQRFVTEANAMALLSAHPSIVTIYFAGIAPDGRPCIVMEYCPRPNLAVRYRRETIPVLEALRIGIRLASAVETAHRAGILHRDIKPANVLVTEYGWPALTDFGISAQIDTLGEAEAMSVPWSAPELLAESPRGDVRTDIYALGATVYALLAGRSPYEVPGGSNSAMDLIARIERDPVPLTGRRDTPQLLEQVLARSMHKRTQNRYRSALDFAKALNEVEVGLGNTPTEIDVMDSVASSAAQAADEDATRMHGVKTIGDHTEPRLGLTPESSGRIRTVGGQPEEEQPQRNLPRLLVGVGMLVILIAVIVTVTLLQKKDVVPTTPSSSPQSVVPQQPPGKPLDVACSRAKKLVSCTWKAPAGVTRAAYYSWYWTNGDGARTSVGETKMTATLPTGTQACVSVVTVDNSQTSPASGACA